MSLCPICNGLIVFQRYCPRCSSEMMDLGKISDYFAPYSPYREIDHVNMSNGIEHDVDNHQCIHISHCSFCGFEDTHTINEKEL
jgi:hypothetical protein